MRFAVEAVAICVNLESAEYASEKEHQEERFPALERPRGNVQRYRLRLFNQNQECFHGREERNCRSP